MNYVICREIDGTGDYHLKQNNTVWERQISHVLSHIWNLDLNKNERHECKTENGGKTKDGEGHHERMMEGEYDQSALYTHKKQNNKTY
jgi:hypothetical protein